PDMPGPKAPAISLSADEGHQLVTLIRAHKTPRHLSFRAQIILRLANGNHTREVADGLHTTRLTIRRWRRHWRDRPQSSVIERLQDEPRPGTPATISVEQWCQIMALACEPPEASGRPISHWSSRELADEAIKRGIVETLSRCHVGRFLKSGRPPTASESLLA
nr:helix-turn-helix domain-containing protein [Pseudomonadota bacterium]